VCLGPTPISPSTDEGFRKGLGELGYTVGRNLAIEYRDAEGTRLSDVARDLVQLKVDVIYARSSGSEGGEGCDSHDPSGCHRFGE
jgi:hypothetical protein